MKNQLIIATFALFFLSSCGEGGEKENVNKKEQPEAAASDNTEYNYTFDAKALPELYAMDKMSVEDTIKRVKITFEYVTEKESADYKFTEVMMSTLLARANKDLSYYEVPSDINQTSSVFYGIVDVSMGKKYISVRYVVDSYTQGAAHHNHNWYALNYDVHKQKIVWLRDIFQFKKSEDSVKFMATIGRNLEEGALELGNEGDSVCVYINNDTEYWVSPEVGWANGLRTAKLHVDSLWNFFRNRPD